MTRDITDLDDFRAHLAARLEKLCPAAMRSPATVGEQIWGGTRQIYRQPEAREWLVAAAAEGWTAPTWPREYGGGGMTRAEAAVLNEEMRRIGARQPLLRVAAGLAMLGPVLLEYGNPEQCARFLPSITRGEVRWCQGYSEPAAGSDLASVQTHAERDGEAFVLNGHKIWSSYAHLSDWAFCLVRTDPDAPRGGGLSFLLVDLRSPGVSISTITLISGRSDFCEMFFDDVSVPVDNLVGGPGQGWPIAKRLLDHERALLGKTGSGLSGGAGHAGPAEVARRHAGVTEGGALSDDVLRDAIARHMMGTRSLKLTLQRFEEEGRADPAVASLAKLVATEASMERQDLIMEALGHAGLPWAGKHVEDADLEPARQWLRSRGNSIEGGTSEIQLNIIARYGLGLPTERKR